MKLNHINLGVTDVPAAVEIFELFFGLKQAEGMPRNDNMTFLHDDDGSLISVFKSKDVSYPKVFHIGFLQDTPEQVRAVHAQLTAGGHQVQAPYENHGRLTFYFNTPAVFIIEVESFMG
ncbi:VOC family protein [Deinococcus detaillensis]|uniref:VOC family protein n=1 Tax=Deinococcus detaillensis TaxID=2592048 RepID=A0A553V0V9_9DEIO|nr:VOC family protein [Deinococcus detaillensis]TSA86104.1 VOC family protein [Deinococcus detaillensis]